MKTIYLCGGINGLADAQCKDWRAKAKDALRGIFEFIDPMDHDYRGIENTNAEEIVISDRNAIRRSHGLLVNASTPSWGTAMEVHYAYMLCSPVIVAVVESGPVSPWLAYHATVVRTFDEAYSKLKEFLNA